MKKKVVEVHFDDIGDDLSGLGYIKHLEALTYATGPEIDSETDDDEPDHGAQGSVRRLV